MGGDHIVKKTGWIVSCLLCFLLNCSAWGQEKSIPYAFVTSETLSMDDVKATMGECLASQGCVLQNVLGIYQEGNMARVYVEYKQKKGKKVIVVDLVRFNSGKWYNTLSERYVIKYVSK